MLEKDFVAYNFKNDTKFPYRKCYIHTNSHIYLQTKITIHIAEKLDENRDRIDLEPLGVIGTQTYMIAIKTNTHKFYLNVEKTLLSHF